jgi:hypothetical protein
MKPPKRPTRTAEQHAGRKRRTRTDQEEELLPDLGTAWLAAGRETSTVIFDRLDLHMLARAGDGDYTSSRVLVAEAAYMVTFELDEARFQALLRLLPRDGAIQVARALGGPFVEPQVITIPPGAIFVGLRARLGAARSNGDEVYVPLIVTSLFEPGPIMSITFEEDGSTGVLEVLQHPAGVTHGVAGHPLRDGDRIDVWLKTENDWVTGRYEHTTRDGAFEPRFAMLQTEHTGGRPIFLGVKVRRPR